MPSGCNLASRPIACTYLTCRIGGGYWFCCSRDCYQSTCLSLISAAIRIACISTSLRWLACPATSAVTKMFYSSLVTSPSSWISAFSLSSCFYSFRCLVSSPFSLHKVVDLSQADHQVLQKIWSHWGLLKRSSRSALMSGLSGLSWPSQQSCAVPLTGMTDLLWQRIALIQSGSHSGHNGRI